MVILNGEGYKGIIELFAHMPDTTFESIFINNSVINEKEMSKEKVKEYLSILRTNIIMLMVIGLHRTQEGVSQEYAESCTKLLKYIISEDLGMNARLKDILNNNNISFKDDQTIN